MKHLHDNPHLHPHPHPCREPSYHHSRFTSHRTSITHKNHNSFTLSHLTPAHSFASTYSFLLCFDLHRLSSHSNAVSVHIFAGAIRRTLSPNGHHPNTNPSTQPRRIQASPPRMGQRRQPNLSPYQPTQRTAPVPYRLDTVHLPFYGTGTMPRYGHSNQ